MDSKLYGKDLQMAKHRTNEVENEICIRITRQEYQAILQETL